MKHHFTAVALAAAALGCGYVGAAVLRDKLANVPQGWSYVETPESSQSVSLTVTLKQQNVDSFHSTLHNLANPEHDSYGQWMKRDELNTMLKPSAASQAAVISWLKANGVTNINEDDFNVNFATDIGTANKLLEAKYQTFEHEGAKKTRTLAYSVPDELDQHISVVSPTTYFGKPVSSKVTFHRRSDMNAIRDAGVCSDGFTPSCIKDFYNIEYKPSNKTTKMAFASFVKRNAKQDDLAKYEQNNGLDPQNFNSVLINGGVDNQAAEEALIQEANLDSQNMIGVGQPIPLTQFIVGGLPPFIPDIDWPTNENEPWLDYLNYLSLMPDEELPQVISHSYGDEEFTVPRDYAEQVCEGFAKLAARGVTVLVASGDTGVGSGCKTANNEVRFNAQFPSSCPWVTSVGGTSFQNAGIAPTHEGEIAWENSGGGFSDFFPRPDYQKDAVSTYLSTHAEDKPTAYAAYTNFNGRASPDVAAIALPTYPIVINGVTVATGGTSASTPVWAAMIALINDHRFNDGKPSMGFINPFLYSAKLGLRDITAGASIGCTTINGQTGDPIHNGGVVRGAAWNATAGWDPVTGLGVPDFQQLLYLALLL